MYTIVESWYLWVTPKMFLQILINAGDLDTQLYKVMHGLFIKKLDVDNYFYV